MAGSFCRGCTSRPVLGPRQNSVEFESAPNSSGFWLYKRDDVVLVRIHSDFCPLLITSIRLDEAAPLEVEIRRLGESSQSQATPTIVSGDHENLKREGLRTQIIAHIQNRGDLTFLEEIWAGLPAQRLWIEAFEIVPREQLPPEHIEYKALDAAGGETPWIFGGEMCGTRGLGVPLLGFAVRLSLQAESGNFDLEYFGRFVSGQIVGPVKNGAPLLSPTRGDPLECIYLAIIPRSPGHGNVVAPKAHEMVAKPKRRKLGANFGVFRENGV